MLPDFLKVKEKLGEKINYQLKQALLLHLGPLADVPTINFVEGNKAIMIREDGSVAEMNPQEMKVEQVINSSELEEMNHEMILEKINTMAEEMAEKQKILSLEVIRKTAEEVGNVVSGDAEPISIDLLFQMLEKVSQDFDEAGNPDELTFVANPEVYASIVKVISQAASDPAIDRRYNEIIERKREASRVRENNRKLVG